MARVTMMCSWHSKSMGNGERPGPLMAGCFAALLIMIRGGVERYPLWAWRALASNNEYENKNIP